VGAANEAKAAVAGPGAGLNELIEQPETSNARRIAPPTSLAPFAIVLLAMPSL
jgi:hypothetical protein